MKARIVENGEIKTLINGDSGVVIDMQSDEFEYAINCPINERTEIIRNKLQEILNRPQQTPNCYWACMNNEDIR